MPVNTNEPAARESGNYDAGHWAFINDWQVNAQEDDRLPMMGTVADNAGPSSARRASTRQSRQVQYKKWSQARHD